MNLKNHKLLLLILLAVFIAALPTIFFIIHVTTGISITQTILYALETEESEFDYESTEESAETEETEEDDPEIEDKKGLDVELYRKAKSIVYDDVPSDFILSAKDDSLITLSEWSPKSWALLYLLAAEICMRDEINPDGAEVIIRPEYLIGEMNLESGYVDYSSTSNPILDLIPKTDYCTWISQGNIDMYSSDAVAPLGQVLTYYTTNNNSICSLYISKLENPNLDDSKRAIVGARNEIYAGAGKYMSESVWTRGRKSLTTASFSEIENNMKIGSLVADGHTYQARPACYYLPDAFYTHALGIRAALNGMTYNECITGYGGDENVAAILNLEQYKSQYTDDLTYQQVMVSAALGQYVGTGISSFLNPTNNYVGKLYETMIAYNISPISTTALTNGGKTKVTTIVTSGGGNACATNFTGLPTGTSVSHLTEFEKAISYLGAGMLSALVPIAGNATEDDILKTVFTPMINSFNWLDEEDLPYILRGVLGKVVKATVSTKNQPVLENSEDVSYMNMAVFFEKYAASSVLWHGGTADYQKTYPYYGMGALNIGELTLPTMKRSIEELYELYGSKDTPKPGDVTIITGIDCLGTGCAHDYAEPTIKIDTYSEMNKDKYKTHFIQQQDIVPILKQMNPEKIVCEVGQEFSYTYIDDDGETVKVITGYANSLVGLHKPVGGTLSYSTYTSSVHAGVDILSSLGIFNAEIHPVGPGVIVGLYSYPYDVATARKNAGEYNYLFQGGTWPGYSGLGNAVVILHLDSKGKYYYSVYAHLEKFAHIKVGSAVDSSTIIGYGGSTGKSTGPHLHLEIRLMSANPSGEYEKPINFTRSDYIKSALEGTSS